MNGGWKLINMEKRKAQYPRTFRLEPIRKREGLLPGDIVEIAIEKRKWPFFQKPTERFWVLVLPGSTFAHYYGAVLDHDRPLARSHGLKAGEVISFKPEHVLQTSPPPGVVIF